MRSVFTLILLISFTLLSTHSFSQGKVETSKAEIKKGNKRPADPSSRSHSSSSSRDERSIGEIITEGIAKVFLYITYYSTIGNYETEKHLHNNLTKYPYYNKHSGNYENADSNLHSKNHFRFDIDYQFLYSNKNLTGNHFKLNIHPLKYFYLQGQYHELTERKIDNSHSGLSLFNFSLCYDRLRFERFNLGWKLGMVYISNSINAGGFSGGVDAEAFLVKPFSLYVSKQWGSINHVAVNEFEIAGRFHIKRYNINLGYEHLKIGSPLYDYISLGAGIRL